MDPDFLTFLAMVAAVLGVLWAIALIALPIKVWEIRARMEAVITQCNAIEAQLERLVSVTSEAGHDLGMILSKIDVERMDADGPTNNQLS